MDPSYLQFIASLMNDDGFEVPSSSRRRPSLGGYPSTLGQALEQHNVDEFLVGHPDFMSRDRAFSWGDAGFEDLDQLELKDSGYTIQDILQSIGRKRTMSSDVNFNFMPMPLEPYQNLATGTFATDHISSENNDLASSILPDASMMPVMTPSGINLSQHPHHSLMSFHSNQQMQMQPYNMAMHNLLRPLMGSSSSSHIDDSKMKVGAYTKEERQARIAKFRAKKTRRVWKKQIKYDCRKKLADTRPRIKGRFVTRKGLEDDENDVDAEQDGEHGEEHTGEDMIGDCSESSMQFVKREEGERHDMGSFHLLHHGED